MLKLTHFFGGHQRVSVETAFPPRLLNLCAQENILFWGLTWHSSTHLSLTLPQKSMSPFADLVARQQGTLTTDTPKGLPTFLKGFRHRVGFLVGLSLSIFAVSVLSQFIFVIEISGNQRVSTGDIRIALEKAGLEIGVYGKSLSLSQMTQVALTHLEEISWMSVNLYGTRAIVTVLETTPPPDIYPTQGLYDIIAKAGGIIEEINLHTGESLVAVGDTVTPGQILVSGNVELEPPIYSTNPSLWLVEVASARIWARTWRELTAVIPLTAMVKIQDKQHKTVTMNSYLWDFFGRSSSFLDHNVLFPSHYEKSRTTYHLPTLDDLPLALIHVEETPYQLQAQDINTHEARQLLETRLLEELTHLMGETGEIRTTDFEVMEKEGLLQVTLHAECYEDIASQVEGTYRQPQPEANQEENTEEVSG